MIKLKDFNLDNNLIGENSHENILIYDISYKTLIGSKPFRIRFDKIDGMIKTYDGAIHLTLFDTKKYDAISQPANIGPQDVPRKSLANVPRTSPKDPI